MKLQTEIPTESESTIIAALSPLEQEQAMIERSADYVAQSEFLTQLQKNKAGKTEADTSYGSRIVDAKTVVLALALDDFYIEQLQQKRKRAVAFTMLHGVIDSETVAFLALKTIVNTISGDALVSFAAEKIGQAVEDEVMMRIIESEETSVFNRITAAVKRKGQLHRKVRTAKFIADKDGIVWKSWEKRERFLVGKTLIELIVGKVGIIDVVKSSTFQRGVKKTVNKICATPATLEWIKDAGEASALIATKYPLMVCPPLPWKHSRSGGYLTDYLRPVTLVKQGLTNREGMSRFLDELDAVEMPLVYEAINRAQNVKWKIDVETLELLEHLAESDSGLGDLPPTTPLSAPPKPIDIDTNPAALMKWKRQSMKVHEENQAIASKRCALLLKLREARKYAKYDGVWMPWTLDFRGRMYAIPTLSPQGTDYTKALLKFADGKPLGKSGAKWLAINIANLFGFDKSDFETRELWTHLHSSELVKCANDPYENRLWSEADKPFLFLQACREWRGYLAEGEDFVSHIPIALDGSCSGLQNFGMALKCEDTGREVNLVPGDQPADIYQAVIDKVKVKLEALCPKWETLSEEDAKGEAFALLWDFYAQKETHPTLFNKVYEEITSPFYDQRGDRIEKSALALEGHKLYEEFYAAFYWLKFGLTRKISKRAVMTFPYGSKSFGFREQLLEDIIQPAKRECDMMLEANKMTREDYEKAYPFITISGYAAAGHMARWLYTSVTETVVKAAEAMHWLQTAAKLVVKENRPVIWTSPLGFPVRQHYHKTVKKPIRTTFMGDINARFILREGTAVIDNRKQAAAVAPNFVHNLDAAHLQLVTARCGLDNLALIHDSFGTLPSDTDHLFKVLRECFHEMYSTVDVFEQFRDEILTQLSEKAQKKLPPTPERGTLDLSLILQSQYCFA